MNIWKKEESRRMKILVICSKAFYSQIPPIQAKLEEMGHEIELPNSYYCPEVEQGSWNLGEQEHAEFKAKMFKMSEERIAQMDAVLTLNFEKHGQANYIGGATFIELYEAFRYGKKIFLYNPIPEGIFFDEISSFLPVVINGDLDQVK